MHTQKKTLPNWQFHWRGPSSHGACPTNYISIEFEIRSKFVLLWIKMYSTDHNKILHTSRQCNSCGMCKISLWSVDQILNHSITNFHWISNSIEISLVGWVSGHWVYSLATSWKSVILKISLSNAFSWLISRALQSIGICACRCNWL